MPSVNRPKEVSLLDITEEYSFDELARGLATDTLSRRKALKLVGAALLGSVLGFFSLQGLAEGQVEAAAVCSGPGIDNDTCVANACSFVTRRRRRRHRRHHRHRQVACLCAETLGGDKTCVDLRGETCPDTD